VGQFPSSSSESGAGKASASMKTNSIVRSIDVTKPTCSPSRTPQNKSCIGKKSLDTAQHLNLWSNALALRLCLHHSGVPQALANFGARVRKNNDCVSLKMQINF